MQQEDLRFFREMQRFKLFGRLQDFLSRFGSVLLRNRKRQRGGPLLPVATGGGQREAVSAAGTGLPPQLQAEGSGFLLGVYLVLVSKVPT